MNYRLGSLYAVVAALLVSTQEPFSFPAAKQLSLVQFVLLTQVALLISVPLLVTRSKSRRDLLTLLAQPRNYWKLAVLFAVGMSGLALFKTGLSNAHPIIISAIVNLQPFWAAMVALIICRVPIPVSPTVFFGCLVIAFLGAMIVAWSQIGDADRPDLSRLVENAEHGTWIYAVPVPILSALGGTLVHKWFGRYDESAAVAANFCVSATLLIPLTSLILYQQSAWQFGAAFPIILMIVGTIVAASVGRAFYQIALGAAGGDNGFVTMFLLLIPALTALISIPLSWVVPDLHFAVNRMFYVGLTVVSAALLSFSLMSWRQPSRSASLPENPSKGKNHGQVGRDGKAPQLASASVPQTPRSKSSFR